MQFHVGMDEGEELTLAAGKGVFEFRTHHDLSRMRLLIFWIARLPSGLVLSQRIL